MNRRPAILATAAILVGCAALCWINIQSTTETRALCRRLSDENRMLQREQQQRPHPRGPSTAQAETTGRTAATAAAPIPKAPSRRVAPDASTLMAQNPALRDLFQRYTQAQLGFQYRPFYHAAKLGPEMVTRFQALVLEQQQEDMDLASAVQASGLAPADAARLRADQQRQHESQLRQLLGDEDYTKYQAFTRLQPMEAAVGSVAMLGAETGEPLTEPQGERLLTVLANNSQSYQQGGQADIWTLNLPQLLVDAAPILSPHQFAVLRGDADMAEAFRLAAEYQTNRLKQGAAKH